MSDEIEKKILELPELPNVVKGDGRYLMSLLKNFLTETANQVNLANGFSAEEILPDDGDFPTPRNFFLSFNRLGASLTWDHIPDVSLLAYYEVRENKNVGSDNGLLERTVERVSSRVPVSYVGTIYLFAVNLKKEYSRPAEINYAKARPEAPEDIALTRNNEGTLITFLEIPLDCVGANVYVNDYRYQTVDNIFLFQHGKEGQIRQVEVAYYDVFGEGERGIVYCVLPDVQGFVVERNGATLDFYWEPLNVHGVEYVVKVGTSLNWDAAMDIFRTKINKHRYVCPNVGAYYFLIKAVDEHNNYSENAAYVALQNVPDISKNVILSLDQDMSGYDGNKLNVYYDVGADGLKLERDMLRGEYIVTVDLPQRYRARNWFDYKVIGITNNSMRWCDMVFPWDSEIAKGTTWLGVIGDLNGIRIRQQIARFTGNSLGGIDSVQLNGTLVSDKGLEPEEAQHAEIFLMGRWELGLFLDDLTRVGYRLSGMGRVFHLIFFIKKFNALRDTVFLTLRNESDFLLVGFDKAKQVFYLRGSDGAGIEVEDKGLDRDWLTFGISQGGTKRALYINYFGLGLTRHGMISAGPMGILDRMYCYPKIIV